jgi:hypothetical protein
VTEPKSHPQVEVDVVCPDRPPEPNAAAWRALLGILTDAARRRSGPVGFDGDAAEF